ncbi:DNA protecting protein DprA [Desulfosporosinus orientis DSM 765]|uniref:DNA protecting protein DprA n=1 Tax=Desulfosporosinus orientis (strain ATCC 19365 / DSM 765 / NCIMB 8382 / VKM B-1628 / Singapore I) TaxID=768706 RepID=G7WE84_DESOD|nr:DNA-processing protein DprA [Desulfosporosinus orientis]AET70060.1 DNA protecting protein DprA [Desulfosporosinus orientis DSM 765]
MGLEEEKIVRAAFRTIKGVGSQRLRLLIACFGSAVKAWEASASQYWPWENQEPWIREVEKARHFIEPKRIGDILNQQGFRMIIPEERDYPALLAELSAAPPLLYYQGQLRRDAEGLGIVGSRKATAYGKAVAKMLARDASEKGAVIISGLARGIDTAAHQGALEAGGITWAVLGCGLDMVYPKENKGLAEEIVKTGALITEYPPGSPPQAAHFPARNRLISGCSRGIVVVEAAERSGALITVDFALEQGREVFAVPGPIFSEASRGTHQLLRQGAKLVAGIEDICSELPVWTQYKGRLSQFRPAVHARTKECGDSKGEHESILGQLSDIPMHIDQIIMNSNKSSADISLALLELQLSGKVLQLPGQHYVLAREP